jgi:hypothetical protein
VAQNAENGFGDECALGLPEGALLPKVVTEHCVRGMPEFQYAGERVNGGFNQAAVQGMRPDGLLVSVRRPGRVVCARR